ncbi:hypothetical protein [Luteimonas sp. MHLX1A]|uniref:hypothetical protein n=1 Tax=Alterluteimonas muca TaxID=2878684 RepID=UPI001E531616|nr:hypothetical protein [Luteimonas sp. MHLX1A]MCD9046821.1 hypothetical protein [Luteimonas sp. MHLX1A]
MATRPTIELNGKLFPASADAARQAAAADPRVAGYYRRTAGRAFHLHNLAGERVGGINCHGVLHSSRRLEDGRYWHSYGTPRVVGDYASYLQEQDEIRAAMSLVHGGPGSA